MNETLGVDLGNTIVDSDKNELKDVIRVLRRLEERFGDRRYVISRVTPEQKIRALLWLDKTDFHLRTGIRKEQVEFCLHRHEKAPICSRLSVTHMIDDRPEVLSHMEDVLHRILFRPVESDIERFKDKLQDVTIVQSWLEIEELLL